MKEKIIDFLTNSWDEITYNLKCLCGEPTPLKRFVIVLIIGGILSIAYVYMLVSSIYNIGKRDAQREFIELQHIERLKLHESNYKLQITSYDYEYEQQSDDR